MREGWQKEPLADLTEKVDYGHTASASHFGNGPKFLRITDIQNSLVDWSIVPSCDCEPDDLNKYHLEQGDIVFARTGATTGKSYLITDCPSNAIFASYLIRVRPNNRVSPPYLAHFFDAPDYWEQVDRSSSGSAQPGVNATKLKNLHIPLPPLGEQERIVAILDAAFAAIATATAHAEKNLAQARELFEREMNKVLFPEKSACLKRSLSDVCSITSSLVDPRELEFIDLPHVGAGNMVSQTGEITDVLTAKEEGLISGKHTFDDRMVLYSKIRPYLMKVCRPDFTGLCSADVYPLLPSDSEISKDYLFYLLLSANFTDYAIKGSARAGMPKVNRSHLFNYKVPLPDLKKQSCIIRKLDDLADQTQRLEGLYQRKLTALAELKQSILQKAFAGELTAGHSGEWRSREGV